MIANGVKTVAELLTAPPPLEAIVAMAAIPHVQIAPTVLATQQGPAGELGPEAAEAKSFAATPEHRVAVRNLYKQRWQYSHFSALWEMTSNHGRVVFCDRCDGITAVSEGSCSGCGVPLIDVHRRHEAVSTATSEDASPT